MKRGAQIRARRQIAVRVGFAALAVASATACIFDESKYQGGGRVDRGGEVRTAAPTASSPPTASQPTQPTAIATDDASVPALFDAGDG